MAHKINPTILREYDLRGIVGTTLSADDACAIGEAFALTVAQTGGRRVAVGFDGRLTSPELEAALVDGLTRQGADVMRIGLGPTPMLYFASATFDVDGAIMVTGSHNPPEYNGFKIVLGNKPFYGAAIRGLGERASSLTPAQGPRGCIERRAVLEDYVARLARDYDGTRPLSVAWDIANGATGEVMQRLVARLPGEHFLLNAEIDGRFPAHHPDPTMPENLVELQQNVIARNCDLGVAFDGDGDRIGVVDAQGRIMWGDQLMVVLSGDVLRRHPGAPIIADVKASQVLFDEIARMGGRPVMAPTGHSPIKAMLAKTGAPLAGEMSGHIFFADGYYGYDDAIYVAVRLLGILGRSPETLVEIADRMPRVVNTPELRFPCDDTLKFGVVEEVRNRLRVAGSEMNDLDGVRVKTADGWWLLRASNTQDVLVARAEAATEAGLERLKVCLAEQLSQSGIALPAA